MGLPEEGGDIGESGISPIATRQADQEAEGTTEITDMEDQTTSREVPLATASVSAVAAARAVVGKSARQLHPVSQAASPWPVERSIMYTAALQLRAMLTRYPQAPPAVVNELANRGWYPARPIGGALSMLAAIIGSLLDSDGTLSMEPSWRLERAAEHMGANEEECIIRIGPETLTPWKTPELS